MDRCRCITGAVFGVCSLLCLALAVSTTYWFELDIPEEVENVEKYRQLTFHAGLWKTCYERGIPPSLLKEEWTKDNCTIDYNFSTRQIEDLSRASIMSLLLAIATIVGAVTSGLTGILIQHQRTIFHAGMLFLTSALCTLIGNCTYAARILLQLEESQPSSIFKEEIGWSYMLSWSSFVLQIISGSIFVASGRRVPEKE